MTSPSRLAAVLAISPFVMALSACGSDSGSASGDESDAESSNAGEFGNPSGSPGDSSALAQGTGTADGNDEGGSGTPDGSGSPGEGSGSPGEGSADEGSGDAGSGSGGASSAATGGAADNPSAGSGGDGTGTGTGGAVVGDGGANSSSAGQASTGEGGSAQGQAGTPSVGAELDEWFAGATVSKRRLLPVPSAYANLRSELIRTQLELYDPGSLMRCDVHEDPAYNELIDTLGGITWGYSVGILEDESKPRFQAGFPAMRDDMELAAGDANASGEAVEIEESDIIGLSATSALFYSPEHGLLMVDLSGEVPTFDCATKLPGRVNKFYFYEGHLVAMTEQFNGRARHSVLLHFDVAGGALSFVEAIDLGAVRILDTRRFNNRLVVYTDLTLEDQDSDPNAAQVPVYYESRGLHRMLRVFEFGDTLQEEMTDTLLDTSPDANYLTDGGIAPETAPGSLVSKSSNFGALMWASDHYFVVTEQLRDTYLTSWETRTYSVCVESHVVEVPYEYCRTIYEERPNPDYTPPDNSGGDRACSGTTLSDCLRAVSRASNPTIQVPVGRECVKSTRSHWICDARESRSYTYPNLDSEYSTRLYIYEYTDDGFVRLDTQVSEITNDDLQEKTPEDVVPTLTTSTETYDLAVPGMLQTLYFQNGMLYAIADGVLQTYAMGGASLVRTSSLDAVDSRLQTSLFTSDKLYLSDFSYSSGHDQSVLRVIDLSNPAFPRQASTDRTLPGGHRTILPVEQGILTVGTVANFEPGIQQVLKLGMFSDPFTEELSYLILGTDLEYTYLGEDKSQAFDSAAQRLFLPYRGYTPGDIRRYVNRVGVSHLEGTSIVSEGAVVMPELPQRVRLRPGATDEALSFASSSIEWLRPATEEWAATPVLEYFKPIALYRLSDEDDYIEVLRLGENCQLHYTTADAINETRSEATSDIFECGNGYPWAYANNIVFSTTFGVEFGDDGTMRELSESEITALYELRPERQYCLFSTDLLENIAIDYENPPPIGDMICYSPEEYQTAYQEALSAAG